MFTFLLAKRPYLLTFSIAFITGFILLFIDKNTDIFGLYHLFVFFEGKKLVGMSSMVYVMYLSATGTASFITLGILDSKYNFIA